MGQPLESISHLHVESLMMIDRQSYPEGATLECIARLGEEPIHSCDLLSCRILIITNLAAFVSFIWGYH